MPHSNSVGGLCWTHSHTVDPVLYTYDSALSIARAIAAETVHLGSEITVARAHIVGVDGFYPLLAAPTCKTEDATDMEFVFQTLLQAWMTTGAHDKVGPLWTFFATLLPIASPLYGILSNLAGLNLYTGKDLVTIDFDFKHVFKRFCTLIRSWAGMYLNNGRCINSFLLERYLPMVEGIDDVSAWKLLYPDDAQDVPQAVSLMKAIISLSHLDTVLPGLGAGNGVPLDANTITDFNAIRILGHILENILQPYINVHLSLSKQVCHCMMPNQLYYDPQSMVKNAIFTIAKQQKLDPSECFSLLDLGDDVLELEFTFLRMTGGHNNAVNFRQALDRLGAARDIGRVYACQPDLMHGHRRLNLTWTEGVDHISHAHWVGDTVSGHCDLPSCWRKGQDTALNILKASRIDPSAYDFTTHFAPGSRVDMLSVFGDGKYPSINDEDDEHEGMDTSIPGPSPTPIVTVLGEGDEAEKGEELPLTFEEAVGEVFDDSRPEDDSVSIDDDTTSDTNSAPSSRLPSGPSIRSCDYLLVEGKPVHKSSVVCIVLNKDFNVKSHDRLLRVHSFTPVNKKFGDLDANNILHGNNFIIGDLFLTLVHTHDKSLALVLARTTQISENSVTRGSVKAKTLSNARSGVKLNSDVLMLLPSLHSTSASNPLWVWNGRYIKTSSPVPGTNITTMRVMSITVPGHLVELANPSVIKASDHLLPCKSTEVNSNDSMWALSDDVMQTAILLLWEKINDHKVTLTAIATVGVPQASFPYHNKDESNVLVCAAATEHLNVTKGKAVTSECPVCGKEALNLRVHMGTHILHASQGILEDVANAIIELNPCGYCGGPATGDCKLTIKETSKGLACTINCPRKETLQYGTATKGSNTNPCCNVPVTWPAIWRYNMEAHISLKHREYSHPGKPYGLPLPRTVFDSLILTALEENKAGVPSRTPFTNIQDKENTVPSNPHSQKCKAHAEKFSSGVKRGQQG
ncbi:hypothetical protein PAXRUDRAFT_36925 [Paxillus rubicundulus Ve08.2h10]|uniref:Uncharacterized protein n=1 Tax=Paxillus rubicundulus Ve08.2h10 TaxID=930991 RepID=A0A0D0D7U6_9AGAM|nr:hypothetical protein PAXRUDRAFT_36925 [Paxillus rubicundulus Ve08.2h10]